ncbi:protein WVD2-like 7 isoform X1 [Daucus carota subsp. sativus]|uniref:protein WVD2-like 7 isoform X1 n=1 Tax=Daucus carota subsp. sativus TaxID=79200 RepID=UPI0007EF5BFF|nr:PREDICTED: protein WVD2-like 7 isoform X1 [Daucus carota subsp. sativus]XP_017227289.1 PREDICTED: protein WVD2-like 7 isoform X1 [Daucus carota subsp. sativus]XP_017227290.1 PREDICTED: protein WVD2-like 7 isoform X1 [Daucus carota subsp. sativus]
MMAGSKIEDPFQLSFKADSWHSGSISFGRFETESLSWERKSSFSHNRYLEEVEKYSKPGSVSEKKAYFEAHYRKKALLRQRLSESQNGSEYQDVEIEGSENMDHGEDFDNSDAEIQQFTHSEESPDGWEYGGECAVSSHEGEGKGVLYSENEILIAMSSGDAVNITRESVKTGHENLIQVSQTEVEISPHINDESSVKQDPEDEMLQVCLTSTAVGSSLSSQTDKRDDNISSKQVSSSKGTTAVETKLARRGLKHHAQQGIISGGAPKRTEKKLSRSEKGGPPILKTEKKSLQTAVPSKCLIRKFPKSEHLCRSKAKTNLENGSSEKEARTTKVAGSQSSGSEQAVRSGHQMEYRSNQSLSSRKEGVKQFSSGFNFKSDQRADKRKEYFNKLEEQMHAKEAEINQIQARTQEKTDAEIKQLRKSLNFRATPMPSFYHGAVSDTDRNKAKPSKVQSKSFSKRRPGSTKSKPEKGQCREPVIIKELPEVTMLTNSHKNSAASSRERNHPSEAGGNSEANPKIVQPQKLKSTVGRKVVKEQVVESKQKVGYRRSSNQMMRKNVKGVDMGSDSKMGHRAVGIAS